MFHPGPKPIIPTIIKARVPAWVLVATLTAQFVFNVVNDSNEPKCRLEIEHPHYSTFLAKERSINAIKLNMKSVCTVPQLETILTAKIIVYESGRSIQIYESQPTKRLAMKSDPTRAHFLEFWVSCRHGEIRLYRGVANGYVNLKNRTTVPVSGTSNKFTTVKCGSSAK